MALVAREAVDRIEVDLLRDFGMHDHPKGLACIRACYQGPQMVVMGGGSGGGGKSHTLRVAAPYHCLKLRKAGVSGGKVFFGTADYPALQMRHLPEFEEWFGAYGKVTDSRLYGLHFRWQDPQIPVILFRNLADPNKSKGSEMMGAFIDETTELPQEIFGAILYMVRKPVAPWRPVLTMTNPDGVGHVWCKRYWRPQKLTYDLPEGATAEDVLAWALDRVNRLPKYTEQEDVSGKLDHRTFVYIPFLPEDNPTFDEDGWWRGVALLPRHIQLARRYGRWDNPEGARWNWLDEKRSQFHIRDVWRTGVPDNWHRIVGVDWGRAKPFCALFTVEDWDGNLWTYQEIYSAGLGAQDQIDLIKERLGNATVQDFRGDLQMWNTIRNAATDEPQPTLAEIYSDAIADDPRFPTGFMPGVKGSKVLQLATLDRYLEYDNGHPDWFIEHGCTSLWGELTGAVYDKGTERLEKREEIDPRCPDHAIDAAIYGFHRRFERPKLAKKEGVDMTKAVEARSKKLQADALLEMRRSMRG